MTPYYDDGQARFYHGDVCDVLSQLPEGSVQTCITSPPYYGLRDYGQPGQLGLETTPEEYVEHIVAVFREVRRVLADDGCVWLNLGDSMLPNKCEAMIPHRVAMALMYDGWICRSTIIWAKPNPMPESVTDRPTKAHEYVFLLTKSPRYYYDADAVREPSAGEFLSSGARNPRHGRPNGQLPGEARGEAYQRASSTVRGLSSSAFAQTNNDHRNTRTVWTIATEPYAAAHFAVFPSELPRRCILAGSREGDTVLDPFLGSGTTAMVAKSLGRRAVGIDLSADYLDLAVKRCRQLGLFTEAS